MKKITLSVIAAAYMVTSTNLNAGFWDTTKIYANKAMFWKKKHFKNITFSNIYPKSFYEKSYFTWIVMAGSIIVAGAVTYFSAGAGAPAAASGVGAVASWIGGGGAGSYMAGLSAIGQAVGGNAILGAAILNGISIGTIGTISGKAGLVLAAKAATLFELAMNGIAILNTSDSNNGGIFVKFDLVIPKSIGSAKVRKMVDEIYDLEDKKNDAIKNGDLYAADRYVKELYTVYNSASDVLKDEINSIHPSQEDLLVLSIISYKNNDFELYNKAIKKFEDLYLGSSDHISFYLYLKGIQALIDGKNGIDQSIDYFERSSYDESYTLEPKIALISILGMNYKDYKNKIFKIASEAESKYDSDKYRSRNNISGLYFSVGRIALQNGDYINAIKYFKKSYDNLNFIIKYLPLADDIKNNIKLYLAISYNKAGMYDLSSSTIGEITKGNDPKSLQLLKLYSEAIK